MTVAAIAGDLLGGANFFRHSPGSLTALLDAGSLVNETSTPDGGTGTGLRQPRGHRYARIWRRIMALALRSIYDTRPSAGIALDTYSPR